MPEETSQKTETLEQLKLCLRILDDKKASNIQVIEVGDISSVTDYVVIATATSDPHLRALRGEFDKTLREANLPIVGVDYSVESGWLVVDAFDFMVHVFLPAIREAYQLEGLWKTAPHLDVGALLGGLPQPPAPVVAKAPAPVKKVAPAKKGAPKKSASKKPSSKKAAPKQSAPAKKSAAKKPAPVKKAALKPSAKKPVAKKKAPVKRAK